MFTHKGRLVVALFAALMIFTLSIAFFRKVSQRPVVTLSAGQPSVQRQRIDQSIETVADMSIAEAIQSLSEYNETYELANLSSLSSASFGVLYINQIRGDRRVTKIWQYLSKLPKEQAAAIAEKMADDKIRDFHQLYVNREQNRVLSRVLRGPKRHAASAALFFCSYFCSPDVLDAKMQLWDRLMGSSDFAAFHGPIGDTPFSLLRYDPLFGANLLVISGTRQGKSVAELNRRLAAWDPDRQPGFDSKLQVSTASLFKSDAATFDTDFTAVTRGHPVNPSDELASFPAFLDPDLELRYRTTDDSFEPNFRRFLLKWRDNG